jgi:hypothetical protein
VVHSKPMLGVSSAAEVHFATLVSVSQCPFKLLTAEELSASLCQITDWLIGLCLEKQTTIE